MAFMPKTCRAIHDHRCVLHLTPWMHKSSVTDFLANTRVHEAFNILACGDDFGSNFGGRSPQQGFAGRGGESRPQYPRNS
eukprot:373328-Prorocentrum_minimum.AAC.2